MSKGQLNDSVDLSLAQLCICMGHDLALFHVSHFQWNSLYMSSEKKMKRIKGEKKSFFKPLLESSFYCFISQSKSHEQA